MQSLSPLQLLPLHVVQLVVNHVASSSRLVFDGVDINSHKYRTLLKPLLWVCHNFRAVAYPRYCNNIEINLSSLSVDELDQCYLPVCRTDVNCRKRNYLGYPTHHLAKDITMCVDEVTVTSGKALETLSRVPYDGCSFPLARKIFFIFVDETMIGRDEDVRVDPLPAVANVNGFVERIKVQIKNRFSTPGVPHQYFIDLASRLYQLAFRIEYDYPSDTADPRRFQLDMISNLTHISCTSEFANGNAYQFIQLAQRNALTLQSLDIECGDAIDVLGLVQDADDNHVSYPCLLILKLKAWLHTQEARRPAFRGAAPFPILQQLLLSFDCQFDDDTFFRGNSATLKVLDMWLDSASISMLWKYKVFVPGSHPKLQVVRLWYAGTIEPVFTSIADALQFINDIGSGAAVREYKGISFHAYLVGIPSSLDSHTCIQVLSLPNFGPDVWQVITLIKSLPLLSDLSTSLPSRGDIPEGVTFDTLPEHIVSNYAPIGRRFRCWHLNKGHDNYCNDPLTCVLLLALACPNFDYADSAIGRDGLFMEMMEGEIYSVRFKPYAPRLRRLLFRGWNAKQD
ncbi:hypothetical protein GGH92_000710 [Coemansia sp. RSA 2673]|nr:hypothetical protein GGH92_000710 [Coemansia sp. RSA 2673]